MVSASVIDLRTGLTTVWSGDRVATPPVSADPVAHRDLGGITARDAARFGIDKTRGCRW
jgi:hypothetical protein